MPITGALGERRKQRSRESTTTTTSRLDRQLEKSSLQRNTSSQSYLNHSASVARRMLNMLCCHNENQATCTSKKCTSRGFGTCHKQTWDSLLQRTSPSPLEVLSFLPCFSSRVLRRSRTMISIAFVPTLLLSKAKTPKFASDDVTNSREHPLTIASLC